MTDETVLLAEHLGHYYQTSTTSPDDWQDKTRRLIEKHGGNVRSWGFGSNTGTEAYILVFSFRGRDFRIIWPVLPTKRALRAARIQAATLMYHDVVARLLVAKVFGFDFAFFQYLLSPDGNTMVGEANRYLDMPVREPVIRPNRGNLEIDITIQKGKS